MQLPINVEGRLTDPEQFGQIVIKNQNGVVTRLSDVARVEIDASQYSLRSLLDNQQAVAIPIFQSPGSNAIQISNHVRATMEELKKNFPEGLDYSIVYDPTVFVRDSIKAVVHTLLEAVALVVLVVILFLQTWRASIIPLLAVPTSIVGTFAAMYMCGFSINALSLFGLVLAIGIVVDDAIVVVENVERNIEAGLQPARCDVAGDERGHRPDHRHRAGAVRRVRADRLHQRLDRRVLSPVRADHRILDHHLGVQFADAVAGAGGASAQRRGCTEGRRWRAAWTACSVRSSSRFNRVFHAGSTGYGHGVRRLLSHKTARRRRLCWCCWRRRSLSSASCRRASCRCRTSNIW